MSSVTKTEPVFHTATAFETETLITTERCTIVHINYYGFSAIRIWPTTFLIQQNGERKKLLHAFNIAMYPDWKIVEYGHRFTLLFEGLDRDCITFELLEDIPEPGGFHLKDFVRNDTDVYWAELND